MRGTQIVKKALENILGIIPADAGNTGRMSASGSPGRDHPRGCGEHALDMLEIRLLAGSSPRMRGTRGPQRCSMRPGRIIPADAGNTWLSNTARSIGEDHPRGCGEHIDHVSKVWDDGGSSPRMRGTLVGGLRVNAVHGIIPADAGNTSSGAPLRPGCGDHPRGCGEHWMKTSANAAEDGSSPRMRGTHLVGGLESADGGIIPADAGNTMSTSFSLASPPDHPRGCGEHT